MCQHFVVNGIKTRYLMLSNSCAIVCTKLQQYTHTERWMKKKPMKIHWTIKNNKFKLQNKRFKNNRHILGLHYTQHDFTYFHFSFFLQVHWMRTFFHRVYRNCWLPFNRISLICVNRKVAINNISISSIFIITIVDVIHCQQIVQVQILCKVVPTKIPVCVSIRQNIAQAEIPTLKIGKFNIGFIFFILAVVIISIADCVICYNFIVR